MLEARALNIFRILFLRSSVFIDSKPQYVYSSTIAKNPYALITIVAIISARISENTNGWKNEEGNRIVADNLRHSVAFHIASCT